MGILLETVLPNRRLLVRLALWRFALCLASAAATCFCFSRPAFDAPLRWLLTAGFWILMDVGWFLAALYPLCFLFRRVEFYETVIYAEPHEIPVGQLQFVRWKQEPLRLLGLFPLPLPLRDRMLCVWREGKKLRRLGVSGFYFSGLREGFDRAYGFSLPWEYTPYRSRKKRPRLQTDVQSPMGPAVPPAPAPTARGPERRDTLETHPPVDSGE